MMKIELALRPALCASLAFGFAVVATGCVHDATGPSSLGLTGIWGGDHISLTVTTTDSHLEFDCAHGTVPGMLTADRRGAFMARGTFVRERGGPIRQNEEPTGDAAFYSGRVTGDTMQLTVRLLDPDTLIGTFDLTRGVAGRVVKCL